jgi:hypothetical protein
MTSTIDAEGAPLTMYRDPLVLQQRGGGFVLGPGVHHELSEGCDQLDLPHRLEPIDPGQPQIRENDVGSSRLARFHILRTPSVTRGGCPLVSSLQRSLERPNMVTVEGELFGEIPG